MTSKRVLSVVAAGLVVGASGLFAQPDPVRIATYNIQFLNANEKVQRYTDLKELIAAVDADVYALQEIDNRAALERVFDPATWQLVIDDDSSDNQDLAVAVRAPLEVVGISNLDANDDDFLFPDASDYFFPNRRDVLNVRIQVPGFSEDLHVLVVHLKARVGGRRNTNGRRAGAAARILERLEHDFDEVPHILLGDFNDNPDDQSLNILETGDPDAQIRIEDEIGSFMVNLTEPLAAQGQVTNSLTNLDVDPHTGQIFNIDNDSRDRNFELRNTNEHTGDILFDQILIPRWMLGHYVPNSITIFTGEENLGSSDHLPVYADFIFIDSQPTSLSLGIQVVELLPNPIGRDAGNETVTLKNFASTPVDLTGWRLRDRSGNVLELSGHTINAGQRLTILIPANAEGYSVFPLSNSGDRIELLNPAGQTVHVVSYESDEANAGATILRGSGP